MPKLTKPGNVTLDQIKGSLSTSLGSQYKLLIKGSRLEIAKDELRGCFVKSNQKDAETEIVFGPFVPSTGLATAMSLVCVGGSVALMLFVNVVLGAVLLPLSVVFRLLPSSGTVSKVKKALEAI